MTDLHAALQTIYAGPTGQTEVALDGWRVDVLRDGVIYEIQTSRLRAVRAKVEALAPRWPLVIVVPVIGEKVLVKIDPRTGEVAGQRRSPRRGRLVDAFAELPSLAGWLAHDNMSVEVVSCTVTEVRDAAGRPPRYRRQSRAWVLNRSLAAITQRWRCQRPADLLGWLDLPGGQAFTAADLRDRLDVSQDLARKVAYTLARSGAARSVGRSGRAPLYESVASPA